MTVYLTTKALQNDLARLKTDHRIHVASARRTRDVTHFINFPKTLFRNTPCWVDPLDIEVRRFLSVRHPFRQHGEAELLLAYRGNAIVGRLLVSDDPRYNELHGTSTGCFGMYHSVDNQEVANELLDAATRWLRERGRTTIIGPIDYSTNYQAGLLVDGFASPPRIFMNHNSPYYARLFENWGLQKAKDLYAWWFTRTNQIDEQWRSRVSRLAERCGVVIRPFRMNDFTNEVARCRKVYNEAWQDNWGFVQMTREEFDEFAQGLRKIGDPNMVLIAEVDGEPVGLAITIPDLNEAIAPLGGRLTRFGVPVGLARLLFRMRKIRTARLVALGVMPGYRRRGIAELLIQRTFDYGKDVLGYTGAELGWTLEDNTMINRAIERVGGRRYKTYRVYEKDFASQPLRQGYSRWNTTDSPPAAPPSSGENSDE